MTKSPFSKQYFYFFLLTPSGFCEKMSSTRYKRQKFVVGDCVETSTGDKCIIHYIGKVDGLSNIEMYGIEYIDGTIAEYDGTYKGKKYFNGTPKRCSFIKYNKIRRKTKHFVKNNNNNIKIKKRRSVKNKEYMVDGKKIMSNNKRKSLPTKLNQFNEMNKTQKHRKYKNIPRRSSASNKGKNKYLSHLEQLNQTKYKKKKKLSTKSAKSHKKIS